MVKEYCRGVRTCEPVSLGANVMNIVLFTLQSQAQRVRWPSAALGMMRQPQISRKVAQVKRKHRAGGYIYMIPRRWYGTLAPK